ncbi:MAG: LysR family transcriptional regulator [Myxococcota bacterium]
MDKWNEIRTAYTVARLGTVSEAAKQLGLHRATVVRHIDTLEETLGGKLFQRHPRGYTTTEAGQDLMRVAQATEEQFLQLAGRTQGRSEHVSGEVVVTSVELLAPFVVMALRSFREAHPSTLVRYTPSNRMVRLEYGEAHVAIRAGAFTGERLDRLDNVVQPFFVMRSAVYAHQRYIDQHGLPTEANVARHLFIKDLRALPAGWFDQRFPEANVVFTSRNERTIFQALQAGMGISFCPMVLAQRDPNLVEIAPPEPAWDIPFCLVTHIDLHWLPKVQALLEHLQAIAQAMTTPSDIEPAR